MTLLKLKPNGVLKDTMVPFNNLFDSFFNEMNGGTTNAASFFKPAVNISETEKQFELSFALPGMEKSEVKVELKDNQLTVSGEKKMVKEENTKYHRVENLYGKFSRSFTLPENVDGNNITAEFKNGILNVVLPKAEVPAPKTIEIK